MKVAQKFSLQYTRLVDGAEDYATDKSLQERIHLGAEYFKEQLEPLDAIRSSTIVETDNKELKKQLKTASEELDDLLLLKVDLLEFVISKGFHVGEYLKQKAVLSIDDTASTKGKEENEKAEPRKVEIPLHGKKQQQWKFLRISCIPNYTGVW